MKDPRFRLLVMLGVSLAVFDQAVKRAVVWYFGNDESGRTHVIDGLFDLILTRNPGAAWSMFGELKPEWLRIAFFILLSLLAIVFIFYYASKAKPEQRLFLNGLAFVLGGALGNLIDRVIAGRVVDFLEFYSRAPWLVDLLDCSKSWGCRFPAFNVADISINVGVGLLILDALRTSFRAEQIPAAVPAPADPGPAPVQTPPAAPPDPAQ